MTHVIIMEACSPKFAVWTNRLQIQERQGRSSPKARNPKELMVLVKSKSNLFENSFLLRKASLQFYSGLQLIWEGPPTLWKAICFLNFTNLNVNYIKKQTPSWHIKLTTFTFSDYWAIYSYQDSYLNTNISM